MRMRERASALHLGELNDSEYLQEIVDFIIDNRNHLPKNISHTLGEAFGKRPLQRPASLRNRQDALDRVRRITLEDIQTPEYLSDVIPLYGERGELFWTGEISSSTEPVFRNVLSDLYYANKRRNTANSVRRAFYCVALYRVMQRIMGLHRSKTFTSNLALFCADLILKDSNTEKPQNPGDIAEELKSDYKTGSVYEPYAQKGGNGIIFYLFILPFNLYEKYLNKNDDVDHVLAHYRSTGFQQDDSTKSAAASIMGFITDRFKAQVSIFKPCAPPQIVKSTRKRGHCNKSSTPKKTSSKRVRTDHQAYFSRSTGRLSFGEGDDNAVAENIHTINNDQSEFLSQHNLDGGLYHVTNCPLPHSLTSSTEISNSFGDSARSPNEQDSHATILEAVNDTGAALVTRELGPTSVTNALLHADVGLNTSQTQPFALSMNTPSNAAHLMNAFQLESMINDINAAQLMQDFHLEPFNLADHTNAAQLMQQFELFNGYYGLQDL
ncbi:hypothetical protein N7540_010967 [Penicillium herquei]|nr:hypothetical protein N7540_010967 [Penicillium herquei]